MAKHDNNRLPLRAVSVHAVITRIEYNEIMNTERKFCMLTEVSTLK